MEQLKTLPLAQRHKTLGARFGSFAGWEMPLWYSGALDEHKAVREHAGVFDISHMGRFQLSGSRAGDVLAGLFTKDARQLRIHDSAYCMACNDHGGIDDDLIVYRLADQRFFVICNAANEVTIRNRLSVAASAAGVELEVLHDSTVLLAVQGPEAVAAVAEVIGVNLDEIEIRTCLEVAYAGVTYLIARTGYTGEDGFEIVAPIEAGARVFDQLLKLGVTPCGLAARDSLRLEAALALHGHEITETTTPWQAGLGWTVDLDHDFAGRDSLIASKENAPQRLAYLVADEQAILRAGCDVYDADQRVGSLTSGGFSPVLNRSIAIGYVPHGLAKAGIRLSVELRGRRIACHTVKRPFYKAISA